jgi:hypothetical protein
MRGSFTLPWDTPSSAPKPSLAISFGPSTSTFRPSSVSFLQRSAISGGSRTLGGSLTRSRVRNTPLAVAFSGSHAALALGTSGSAPSASPASACPRAFPWCDSGRTGSCAARRRARPRPPVAPTARLATATVVSRDRPARSRRRLPPGFLRRLGRFAEADRQHAGQAAPGARIDAGLALGTFEFGHFEGAGDGAAGGFVELRPQAGGFLALVNQQHKRAGFRQRPAWRKAISSMVLSSRSSPVDRFRRRWKPARPGFAMSGGNGYWLPG